MTHINSIWCHAMQKMVTIMGERIDSNPSTVYTLYISYCEFVEECKVEDKNCLIGRKIYGKWE